MIRPRIGQIDVPAGTPDDYVPVVDGGSLVYAPVPSTGVESVTGGSNVTVDNTDPQNPVVSVKIFAPLTTEVGGAPDFVWDDDNQQVMTECFS